MQTQVAGATELSTWSWSGTSSINNAELLKGTADFSIVTDGPGFDLVIILTNTATHVPAGSADILTGLYFNLSSPTVRPGALSMYSAVADLGMLTNGTGVQTAPNAGTAGTNACATGAAENALAPNATNCTVDGGWEAAYKSTGIGGGASATQHYGVGTSGQGGVFHGADVNTFDYGVAPGNGVGVDQHGEWRNHQCLSSWIRLRPNHFHLDGSHDVEHYSIERLGCLWDGPRSYAGRDDPEHQRAGASLRRNVPWGCRPVVYVPAQTAE